MSRVIYALFDRPADVRQAIADLKSKGVAAEDITVSAKDPQTEQLIAENESNPPSPVPGAGIGAAAGAVAGTALSLVPAALAAPLAAPVFVLFGLSGAMVGAITGSVAGGILGTGYQVQYVEAVEQSLAEGKILVAVKTSPETVSDVEAVLERNSGILPKIGV